jgi:hypothetical protein
LRRRSISNAALPPAGVGNSPASKPVRIGAKAVAAPEAWLQSGRHRCMSVEDYGISGGRHTAAIDKLEELAVSVKAGCFVRDAPKPAMSAHPARRHRRSNNLFAGISQNSHHGRRIIDLSREYLAQLGHPSSLTQQAAVFAAVQLLVIAEDARLAVLASMPPTMDQLDQLVRVEAIAARAIKRLGLDKPPSRTPAGPSLDAYLTAKREAAP